MSLKDNTKIYIKNVYEFKVSFYDLDPIGVMWHGNYVKHMEDARQNLLDNIGYNYDKHIESGYIWPVVTMNIKYRKPLKMGQVILVETNLIEYENCLRINYRFLDKNTLTLLTTSQTTQLPVNTKTQKPLFSTPDFFIKLVEDYISNHKN